MAEGEEIDGDAEVVYESASDSDDSDDSDDDSLPEDGGSGITYGDTQYELVLPSGARIGHRKHQNIHKQNFLPYLDGTPFTPPPHASQAEKKPSAHSQALLSLVPMMKKDKTHARPIYEAGLIPAKGSGFGGKGGEVIKARNKGEAKEAGKATRQFKELRRFNDQALIKGIRGNNQKHVSLSLVPHVAQVRRRTAMLTRTTATSVPRSLPPVEDASDHPLLASRDGALLSFRPLFPGLPYLCNSHILSLVRLCRALIRRSREKPRRVYVPVARRPGRCGLGLTVG